MPPWVSAAPVSYFEAHPYCAPDYLLARDIVSREDAGPAFASGSSTHTPAVPEVIVISDDEEEAEVLDHRNEDSKDLQFTPEEMAILARARVSAFEFCVLTSSDPPVVSKAKEAAVAALQAKGTDTVLQKRKVDEAPVVGESSVSRTITRTKKKVKTEVQVKKELIESSIENPFMLSD